MRLRSSLWIPLLLVATVAPVSADPIAFAFGGGSGNTALAGTFLLDDAATWAISTESERVSGVLSSPIQQLWGTFGEYSFTGTAELHVLDNPSFRSNGSEVFTPDYWIVRATLSGTTLADLRPMWLNLFVYTSAPLLTGLNLTPPPHSGSPFDFQYSLGFGNERGEFTSSASGGLTELQRVPEPSVYALFVLGVGTLSLSLRRRSSATRTTQKN
jgi:hypothetical protein